MGNQTYAVIRSNLFLTLTKQDLEGIGVKVQGFSLLLHDIHLLCVLVVIAVHTGVGQHLSSKKQKSLRTDTVTAIN